MRRRRQLASSLRGGLALLLIPAAVAIGAARAQPARAVILPAVTVDGPSEDIEGFGGVAMAEDGTGGLVYLKRVEGVAHVFVSRYVGGHWLVPIRVDTEEPYAASWPRIGAANGGELEVVWATPFATEHDRPVQELLGATLGPGSSLFGRAIIIDPNINEATGTSPDLAMSSTGYADVVYRVTESNPEFPLLRPGDVDGQVRVAHFNGERWSRLGIINRDLSVSMRAPTQANAPEIAIGPTGNGVVVWQEPEITGQARIWARRVFGSSLDYVMPVSAEAFNGAPIEDDADAPSVAVSRLGQAEVAYRQAASAGSPLPGPRVFVNVLPDGESSSGAEFQGATMADPSVSGGKSASVGRPSIDIDERRSMRLLYDSNGTPRVIESNDKGVFTAAVSLGPPFVGSAVTATDEVQAASVMNPEGGGISAWPSASPTGSPAMAVREDFPSGEVQTGLLSGGAGGPIGELAVARSGLGDGIVAFQQGPTGNGAIVAAQISAPPQPFVINVPKGWVKPSQATVSWEGASSADGPLRYAVVLDGRPLATSAGTFSYKFSPHSLGDGDHKIEILATDIFGQSTLSAPSELQVDGRPPKVSVIRTRGNTAVLVRITDTESGVDKQALSVSFGDGHDARGAAAVRHHYARAGVYEIVVKVRDRLGNAGVVHEVVSVR
jgi:hypothetical protein